ncbi:MAG: NAD-dependent epimerase/dehydratase family protein [Desulfovibrio sp.]|jgi:CDP-paratose 2-epimerase|nr:NAD-dependent epimerase/dehydratase family protein [Desulfovibrio sp.]
MASAIVTGSGGLIGSAAVRFLIAEGLEVIGIDNNARRFFFGPEADISWNITALRSNYPQRYRHENLDIRDEQGVRSLFARYGKSIVLVVHAAAQPSHDWAGRDPHTDFSINAAGTLNILEATRRNAPEAVFIFTSTNKVYGDTVNRLEFQELETRYEPLPDEPYAAHGVDERMSTDRCMHSIFGASKVAADIMVQEYGRYFGLATVIFRGGCLTGPDHSAARLHGFLGYLVRCAILNEPYTIFGYKGKQVRDNIHADDVVNAFLHCFRSPPPPGEVFNLGGGRTSNISILEAVDVCEKLTGNSMRICYDDKARTGDHQWWISDTRKFQSHYPQWKCKYTMNDIIDEIYFGMLNRKDIL